MKILEIILFYLVCFAYGVAWFNSIGSNLVWVLIIPGLLIGAWMAAIAARMK